jgi:hypothetical protein
VILPLRIRDSSRPCEGEGMELEKAEMRRSARGPELSEKLVALVLYSPMDMQSPFLTFEWSDAEDLARRLALRILNKVLNKHNLLEGEIRFLNCLSGQGVTGKKSLRAAATAPLREGKRKRIYVDFRSMHNWYFHAPRVARILKNPAEMREADLDRELAGFDLAQAKEQMAQLRAGLGESNAWAGAFPLKGEAALDEQIVWRRRDEERWRAGIAKILREHGREVQESWLTINKPKGGRRGAS